MNRQEPSLLHFVTRYSLSCIIDLLNNEAKTTFFLIKSKGQDEIQIHPQTDFGPIVY